MTLLTGLHEGRTEAEAELEALKRHAEIAKRRADLKLRRAKREVEEMRQDSKKV